jgi:hypothetical protein
MHARSPKDTDENAPRHHAHTLLLRLRRTLQLPNVGWNYLDGSIKKRVYVIDADSGDKVASSNPQPLTSGGGIKTGAPDIIERRVQKEVAFNQFFGQPTQA